MKYLILFLILFFQFSLHAQDDVSNSTNNDQNDIWMNKISSNSEMRSKIMDMMIEKTSGNEEEMMKLVNSMLSNQEMHEMIIATISGKEKYRNILLLNPRGSMHDTIKTNKSYKKQPETLRKK